MYLTIWKWPPKWDLFISKTDKLKMVITPKTMHLKVEWALFFRCAGYGYGPSAGAIGHWHVRAKLLPPMEFWSTRIWSLKKLAFNLSLYMRNSFGYLPIADADEWKGGWGIGLGLGLRLRLGPRSQVPSPRFFQVPIPGPTLQVKVCQVRRLLFAHNRSDRTIDCSAPHAHISPLTHTLALTRIFLMHCEKLFIVLK